MSTGRIIAIVLTLAGLIGTAAGLYCARPKNHQQWIDAQVARRRAETELDARDREEAILEETRQKIERLNEEVPYDNPSSDLSGAVNRALE